MFEGRKLVVATMHGKEKVIAPLFQSKLGVLCHIPSDFNSDVFGTFSGEIDRIKDPLETAREKCYLAMQLSNCDLAVSSEGSFGPHPFIPFAKCDQELLLFVDRKNNIEISWNEISLRTNYSGAFIRSINELKNFTKEVKFPSHALIIKVNPDTADPIHKGIKNRKELEDLFHQYHQRYNSVYIETDMRAMHNPTRMQVINTATKKLISKIRSNCPKCNYPGFAVVRSVKGLLCEDCKLPTRSALKHIKACLNCGHEKEMMYPYKKQKENPMYCDFCNP